MSDRPNFLFIITDQHRADHLGCYGNPVVRTPHIDALAAAGTRFERFYTATPICMPNRATLMTGRMPSLHGVRHNGIPLSLEATTFTDVLSAAGYQTALIGKCHLQSIRDDVPVVGMPQPDPRRVRPPEHLREARKDAGGRYDQELPSTWAGDPEFEPVLPYYGFQHMELCIKHADQVVGHYERWLRARHPAPDSLRGRAHELPGNACAAPQAWRTRVPEELYPTSYVAERTVAFLEEHARSGRNQPFFLQCSFPDPHHAFTPPGRYWDMYHPEEIALPGSFHHGEQPVPPHLARLYEERDRGEANRNGQRAFAVTAREVREAIALTYGMITMIDDAIGRIRTRLEELNLAEDTVIVFTSDHGDFMGDHQLLLKAALHYRGLVRVPFIWVDPATGTRGVVQPGLCGTLDLPSTILDRAGLEGHNGMQGASLLSAMDGAATGYDSLLIEEHQRRGYMGLPNNFRARTLITPDRRLTLYEGAGWGEVYDLANDPDEMHNLWDDPGSRRTELLEILARQMMDLTDTSPLATHHGP